MRKLVVRDLGRMNWLDAFHLQQHQVDARKQGAGDDTLLFVEHPHVVTMGRNGNAGNLLASPEVLSKSGIQFFETNRGGDVTYHGPGQIVGYPLLDLRLWKRDVGAYVRGVEEVLIRALAAYGVAAGRNPGKTGVWVNGAKVAAIGIHISRWITSHGFALNHQTDLNYFRYIVPCGLSEPVTSMQALGVSATRQQVMATLAEHFAAVFDFEVVEQQPASEFREEKAK